VTAKIYIFKGTCPKPAEVVSQVEGQMQANIAFCAAVWRMWFVLWGIGDADD
jgi:hypothetical protein